MAKKLKTFTVMVTVKVDTDIEVKSESLEQAISIVHEYGVKDVVEFEGGFNDGSVEVTGAFQ